MKREQFPRIAVIESESATQFEKSFNEKMDELSEQSGVSYRILERPDKYCAIISYEVTVKVVENAKDEFNLEGVYYLCRHCPYLVDPHDKRIKHCDCEHPSNRIRSTHKDYDACNVLYEGLKNGTLKIRPDADLI